MTSKKIPGILRLELLLACAILLSGRFVCSAQELRPVTGTVKDQTGQPMIGVSVLLQGSFSGTTTDLDGAFALKAAPADTLRFSFIGYVDRLVPVGNRTRLEVTMTEAASSIDEVVVIGYGVARKEDLTGAISSVSSKSFEKQSAPDLGAALQGRAAGLQVTSSGKPGDNVSFRIRGVGSINNSDPLVVIDGVPTDMPLNALNMSDVESVDVLKDASATAIYGSRGAYGVMIVTTRKGRSGNGQLKVRASYGVQQATNTLRLLTAEQFASLHNEMMRANGQPQYAEYADPTLLGKGTDWQDALFRTGATQDYTLSYSGGGEKSTYYVSGSVFDQQGIVRSTDYRRYTMRFNSDTRLFPWLKLGNNLTLNHDIKASGGYDIRATMAALPTQPIRNEDGSWSGPVGDPKFVGDIVNPIGRMELNTSKTRGYNMLGSIYAELRFCDWLSLRSTAGLQALFWDAESWTPKYDWEPIAKPESEASRSHNKSWTWLWDNILTFDRTFVEKHRLTVMAGVSAQENTYEYFGGSIQQFVSSSAQQLDNGVLNPQVFGNGSDWALFSFIGRVNYTYAGKYLLTATIRRDGSSRFSPANRWSNFPSVSAAWRISEEKFYGRNDCVSDLKLRAGYGLTGNQASVGNYASASRLNTVQYNFNGTQTGGLAPWVLPNPNVRWEEVEQYNVGLDMTLFRQRINLSIDAYIKNTNDMLVNMSVPISTGYSDEAVPQINAGRMRNKGIEVSLTSRNVSTKEWFWQTSVNVSYNHNELLALNGNVPIYTGSLGLNQSAAIHAVGHSIGAFYGYVTDGIFQNQAEVDAHALQVGGSDPYNRTSPGDIRFRDLDNNGVIDDRDRTYLGNPTPSWSFAMNNSVTWRNFDLEVFIQGVAGNRIFNATRMYLESMSVAQNQSAMTLGRWRGEGTSDSMPRAVFGDPNKNARVSDRFVEDGAYLRLKNLSLGYTLPERITRKFCVSNLRVYFSGQNLLTLTRYSGFDPEVGASGIDNNIYPQTRSYTFGLDITF